MTVDLSVELDRDTLSSDGGTPIAEVSFSTSGKTKLTEREIVLCIDTSGSMGSNDEDGVEKLERAKRGAKQVLEELNPEDSLAVVGFDSDANVVVPFQRWDQMRQDQVEDAIDDLVASNGTDIYAGIESSWEEFGTIGSDSTVARRIILLSDGQDWREPPTYRSLGEDVNEDGISIVAAGIGSEYDEEEMIALAEGSNGTPAHLTAAMDMESFFRDEVATAGAVVANNPELHVETGEGFRLDEAYIAPPNARTTSVSTGDEEATIDLPDLTDDSDLSVTVQFLAPPRSPGIEYELAEFVLESRSVLDRTSVDIEYVESTEMAATSEDIQIRHADATVSAGIRDTETPKDDIEEAIDGIDKMDGVPDSVVDDLERKLQDSESEDGGSITAGLTKIDPDE